MSELLTLAEAAERLNMSTATVRRHVHDGTLAGAKLGESHNAPQRFSADKGPLP
jgi:excisionase family DNA binding protein